MKDTADIASTADRPAENRFSMEDAPKTAKEYGTNIGRSIGSTINRVVTGASDYYDQAKSSSGSFIDTAKQTAMEARDGLMAGFNDGMGRAQPAAQTPSQAAKEAKADG